MDENQLSYETIGAIIEVHKQLGPGLPEAAYQEALELELTTRGIPFEREKRIQAVYKGKALQSYFRLDLLIGGKLSLELKAVEAIRPVHEAQLLAYLRLTGCRLGILVNFNVERTLDGIYRRALKLPEGDPRRTPAT